MRQITGLCAAMSLLVHLALANTYYVTVTGSDSTGDGSQSHPWRTLLYAASQMQQGGVHTIRLSEGIFVEAGQISLPPGLSIEGAGRELTFIRAASSFHYYPDNPEYAPGRFLFSLISAQLVPGNQSLKNFTIDGDSKMLHGGIYVRNRSHVLIDSVQVQNTHFNGIWFWDVADSQILNSDLIDCSWGSAAYCAGALHLGNIHNVEIGGSSIDEGTGYGIKAIGPVGNFISALKIHDTRISVNPIGLWNDGSAPNIAVELFQDSIVNCEIYNSYIDNTISVVTTNQDAPTNLRTIRIHNNTLDLETRSQGSGYAIELTVHNAEVDHNYFIKGTYGIANWHQTVQSWDIHHNIFYALGGTNPGEVLRSQTAGLQNVKFYNNTVEFAGSGTANVVGLYGGTSDSVSIINNLFINSNSAYSYYPNELIHIENDAQINNLEVRNNFFQKLPIGELAGAYTGNLEGNPKIYRKGARPVPYYLPTSGSPLIGSGLSSAELPSMTPDIGACAFDEVSLNEYAMTHLVLTVNAGEAQLSGHMELKNDSTATSGNYFTIPSGYGTNYTPGASSALFNFDVLKTDNYFLWVKVRSPGPDNQAYYIYDGKGNWTAWMAGVHDDWSWVKVRDAYTNSIVNFPFTQGANLLVFSWLHENTHVDQAIITNDATFSPEAKDSNATGRLMTSAIPSAVERPRSEARTSVVLYPNPVKRDFTITLQSPIAQEAVIKVISSTSVIVKSVSVCLNPGENTIKLDSDNIANGLYLVSLITSTGESFIVKTAISK